MQLFLLCTSERPGQADWIPVIADVSIQSMSSFFFVQDCESSRNWITVKMSSTIQIFLLCRYFNGLLSTEGVMYVCRFFSCNSMWINSLFRIFYTPNIDKYTWISVSKKSDEFHFNHSTVIIIRNFFNTKRALRFACQCLLVPYDFQHKQWIFRWHNLKYLVFVIEIRCILCGVQTRMLNIA
jgi:hypothetical protein